MRFSFVSYFLNTVYIQACGLGASVSARRHSLVKDARSEGSTLLTCVRPGLSRGEIIHRLFLGSNLEGDNSAIEVTILHNSSFRMVWKVRHLPIPITVSSASASGSIKNPALRRGIGFLD